MEKMVRINQPDQKTMNDLLQIWESAVIETHTFLSKEDIRQIKLDVKLALRNIAHLYGYFEENQIWGFIGVENNKVEMLFIDAVARGKGVGRQLLMYAVEQLNARFVDVNEQNVQGVGFYKHMGFSQIGRSELDEQGRAFPILHMEKE